MEEIYYAREPGLMYQWNEFHVFKDSDNRYRVDIQSGCSCNEYSPDPHNCKPVMRREVVDAFTEWCQYENPVTKTEMLEKLIQALNKG